MTYQKRTGKPPFEMRIRVISAVDFAPGNTIRARIQNVASRTFWDENQQREFKFTWRTISTWLYRYKKNGLTTLENKKRQDKGTYRKVKPEELAEGIKEILPKINVNKKGKLLKSAIYRLLLNHGLFQRAQLSQTSFYRMVRENNLLDAEASKKLRLSFAMKFANELWQADTMYGPSIKQPDGSYKKTFLIAFIDDASRVITHAEFFYHDNTENMIDAFRSALYKRGKPERLYFDNGSNYKSKEILMACARLNIKLIHAPIRDGAAKGKIERFFRGFRDRFLVLHSEFKSLDELNKLTWDWLENEYNSKYHSGIQMIPLDRFNIDLKRIKFISNDEYTDEVFMIEETRNVRNTNLIQLFSTNHEMPVDLRNKKVQVRYDRTKKDKVIVYYKDKRMGIATPIDLYKNSFKKREEL